MSVRGNELINNNLAPYSYADGLGGRTTFFLSYIAPFVDTSLGIPVFTTVETNSAFPRLKGTFPMGINGSTNIMIDVYQLDPEGWANGKAIAGAGLWMELTDYVNYTNGFPQGAKFLRSFPVPNTGTFDVDLSGLDVGLEQVTVTANY